MINARPSPNFDDRPAGAAIDALVLHYTGMQSGAAALARLTDPEAKVSAHFLVEEDGSVFRLVAEEKRAWHAGVSFWAGQARLNDVSIGVEIVNPGHEFGLKPFPHAQIDAVTALSLDLMRGFAIPAARVLAHSDIAPDRKLDPGELFPWEDLARRGVGLWPDIDRTRRPGPRPDVIDAQRMLAAWGYPTPETGAYDAATAAAVAAFQRRFRPEAVDGVFDAECAERLGALLSLV